MTIEEEYYNVYLPQKWKQEDIVRNIRNKITSEEYEFIGKLYMCKAIGEIKAEIVQTVSRYSISRECGCMGQVEWSDRLIKESEVLQIIDKHIGGVIMTDYENEVITIRPQLIAKKLRDDNSNFGKKCIICETYDIPKMYEVNYDKSEYIAIYLGNYCKDCMYKVFGKEP